MAGRLPARVDLNAVSRPRAPRSVYYGAELLAGYTVSVAGSRTYGLDELQAEPERASGPLLSTAAHARRITGASPRKAHLSRGCRDLQ